MRNKNRSKEIGKNKIDYYYSFSKKAAIHHVVARTLNYYLEILPNQLGIGEIQDLMAVGHVDPSHCAFILEIIERWTFSKARYRNGIENPYADMDDFLYGCDCCQQLKDLIHKNDVKKFSK